MARNKQKGLSEVYQLKITLRGSKPPIWRRILVPGRSTLPELNLMIQAAMGWCNCHLHSFTIDAIDYAMSDPNWGDMDCDDEAGVRLDRVARRAGGRFIYLYDFGDGWEHQIVVEKILPPESGVKYPVCIAGKRRCPPEDVGGVWGYQNFLEAIRDPKHSEHAEYLEWVGGEFDPEEFDLDAVNGVLGDYKLLDMGG
jgi:hypothetical protein